MLLYPRETRLEEQFYLWALRLPNQTHPDVVSAMLGSGMAGARRGPPSATSPVTPAVSAARWGREPGPSAPCGRKQARWAILGRRDPRRGRGSWGLGLR